MKTVVRDPLMFSGGEWGHVALPFPVMQLWWTACRSLLWSDPASTAEQHVLQTWHCVFPHTPVPPPDPTTLPLDPYVTHSHSCIRTTRERAVCEG